MGDVRLIKCESWALAKSALLCHARLMRPVFDDSAVVHHNDAIDAMDGGEAMGNDRLSSMMSTRRYLSPKLAYKARWSH